MENACRFEQSRRKGRKQRGEKPLVLLANRLHFRTPTTSPHERQGQAILRQEALHIQACVVRQDTRRTAFHAACVCLNVFEWFSGPCSWLIHVRDLLCTFTALEWPWHKEMQAWIGTSEIRRQQVCSRFRDLVSHITSGTHADARRVPHTLHHLRRLFTWHIFIKRFSLAAIPLASFENRPLFCCVDDAMVVWVWVQGSSAV
jgi:hypothetical protein